jgi:hypothetical protein
MLLRSVNIYFQKDIIREPINLFDNLKEPSIKLTIKSIK